MPRTRFGHVLAMGVFGALTLSTAFAQQAARPLTPRFHTAWTAQDGAPSGTWALAQTADGYLWLATPTGWFRFDGVHFELFQPTAGRALLSPNTTALLALHDGGLMIGYQFGGATLIEGDQITNFTERDGLRPGVVWGLAQDSDGTIWAATFTGLARFAAGRWTAVGAEHGLTDGPTDGLLIDQHGVLWVSKRDGVLACPRRAVRCKWMSTTAMVQKQQLAESPSGAVWGSVMPNRIDQLTDDTGAPLDPPPTIHLTNDAALLFDRTGDLWAAGAAGVERIAPGVRDSSGAGDAALERITKANGLSGDAVTAMLEDREGSVWIATTEGIDRFRRAKLTAVPLSPGQEDVAIAAADDGAVWIGGRYWPARKFRGHTLATADGPPPVARERVDCAYRDREGRVWLGGAGSVGQLVGHHFVPLPWPSEAKANPVQAIAKDRNGALWISIIHTGVFRMEHGSWTRGDAPPFSLPPGTAITIVADSSGRIWFGYPGNRVALIERDTVHLYTAADGLGVGNVLSLQVHGDRMWIGGENGLEYFAGGRFHRVIGDGNDEFRGTSGIVEQRDGQLWLNGSRGASRIAPEEIARVRRDSSYRVRFERFDFRDGLPGVAAQVRPLPSAIQGTDGRIWFVTGATAAWVNPDVIARNAVVPPVLVQSLTANGVVYAPSTTLSLPLRTTSVEIDYTALSLSTPERVRFRYRLEGNDSTWQEAGGRRQAFYTNLRPGPYRFRVIAANDDGVWNDVGASLGFDIPPTFTQTKWFLALCILASLSALWAINAYRLHQSSRAIRRQYEATLAERMRIAQELHDTLLQGFTGITWQLRALAAVRRDAESDRAVASLVTMAETTLGEARQAVSDMRASPPSVAPGDGLANRLERAARDLIGVAPIAIDFAVAGERRALPCPVEDEMFRVGREAIANAVKHGPPRRLVASLEYEPGAVRLTVRDDGHGFDVQESSADGGHFGLLGMRERARRIGADLTIDSHPGKGTTVVLVLSQA